MRNMYVVTHPAADHHDADLVGGWYDSHLTDRGRLMAEAIATELKERLSVTDRPVRITTSDLARCTETAAIIAPRLDVPVTADERLREISYGEAEGRPNTWLDERQIPATDDNRLDHRGPIVGAETRREVATRVASCVRELMHDDDHDHVIVTHGFAQTFVIAAWLQLPVDAVGFVSFASSPGSITHLGHDDHWRNRVLASLADTSHLSGLG